MSNVKEHERGFGSAFDETPQILQAILPAGQFVFCRESKAEVATKLTSLKDGD